MQLITLKVPVLGTFKCGPAIISLPQQIIEGLLMDVNSLALIDLKTGETQSVNGTMPNTKFLQRGHKMYNTGVLGLIELLTKEEIKRTILLFDSSVIDYNNILMKPFLELTKGMSKAARSRYKHKLIDNRVMQECNGKLMLNPFIFVPRGDKNITNSQHLTQRVWKYLFEDANLGSDEVIAHAERLFGKLPGPGKLLVGSGNFTKLIELPTEQCK